LNRVLLGYILIALIGSTAFCLLVFGERSAEPFEILEVAVPERLFAREVGTTDQFSLALVARRKIASVELRFGVLRERQPGEEPVSGSPMDRLKAIGDGRSLAELFGEADGRPDEIETRLTFGGLECEMVALDFTPMYARIANETDLRHTPTMFAAVFWPNGSLAGYFRGYAACFPAMQESLYDMKIVAGEETLYFRPDESAGLEEGVLPLSEAPVLGLLRWKGLRRDDRVVVQYKVHGSAFKFLATARAYFSKRNLYLVQIWVDGEPWRTIARDLPSAVGG